MDSKAKGRAFRRGLTIWQERWPEVARHRTLNPRYAAYLTRGPGVVGSRPTLSAKTYPGVKEVFN